MMRFAVVVLVMSGFVLMMSGCTNTVRGLGQDFNSGPVQDYNSHTATEMD